jgi:hypothetical protein
MAAEILLGDRVSSVKIPLMQQADGVPDFVRSDAGDFIGAKSSNREDETWVVHVAAERIQVGDATSFARHRTNDDPDTVIQVA